MSQKMMIIDTDCGIDDAQAIMLALSSSNVKILGISCCFGNTDVESVCKNVLRVLSVCQRTEVGRMYITAKLLSVYVNFYEMFKQLHSHQVYHNAQVF